MYYSNWIWVLLSYHLKRQLIFSYIALKDNSKLKELDITASEITDNACDAITAALKRNSCLTILGMYGNPLSSEAIIKVVQCLKVNNTLQLLGLPHCLQGIQEYLRSLQEVVNKKRENQLKLGIKFSRVS